MEETVLQIPNSFEDFMKQDVSIPIDEKKEEETLEHRFNRERFEWTNKIKGMSEKMKDIFKVSELMTEIYTERQRAVEYYHFLLGAISKVGKIYRKSFADKYDYYSYKSQKRFPNEKLKENQILSEMSEVVEKREQLEIHAKFINGTIGTIDNLIYGIKYKVEIEQISRGR